MLKTVHGLVRSFDCVCVQGLVGSVPNLGGQICSKMTSLSLQNTNLMQCNATHLSALQGNAAAPQVLPAVAHTSCKTGFC